MASHQSLLLLAYPLALWMAERTVKLLLPLCECVCLCAHVYCVCMNWRWSCGVSDDTGGVIPPTSASNLQHEKDTRMTPYVPPTIFYPHPTPSAWCCSFSFQPKSNSVSSYERFWPQLAIRHTKQGVYICFMCILPFPHAVVQEFHSVCCLLHVLFELLFFPSLLRRSATKGSGKCHFFPHKANLLVFNI